MNFDFAKTLSLVKGGLTDHEATWKNYLEDCPDWQSTAITLTGPLILANIILGVIFSHMIGGFSPYGYYSNIFSAIFWSLILACLGLVIAVLVFNFFAGIFKGSSNFSRAFAAVSLVAIPSWISGIVAALIPGFIGAIIALIGGILSLVWAYKIMPLALAVPDDKRVVHFITSFIAILILNIVVGTMLGGAAMPDIQQASFSTGSSTGNSTGSSSNRSSAQSVPGSGMLGDIERQSRLMESATSDQYEPPADGKLTEEQVTAYASVMRKTRVLHEEYAEKMQKLSEEMEAREKSGETASFADMSKIYSGIGSSFSANNAEMEVVKTGQGNWAEHNWVKNQLRAAHIQQGEGSEALEHNYKLYREYQADIGDV